MNYSIVVPWDVNVRDVWFLDTQGPMVTLGLAGLAAEGKYVVTGAPTATAGHWAPGAIVTNLVDGTNYEMTGTTASPAWTILATGGSGITALTGDVTATGPGSVAATIAANAVVTAKIANANVTLAKLAPGITPSHIVVFAGKITWSGSGASLATTVAGVLSTDIVVASIQTAPTQAATLTSAAPTTNTVTLVLSAANTSNNAVISYQVLRVAS